MTRPSVAFIYPGSGRESRIAGIQTGETPKDFFYGYTHLDELGYPVSIVDSRRDPDSWISRRLMKAEYYRSRLMGLGVNTQRVHAIAAELAGKDIALSFTDSFSLSMGLYGKRIPDRPVLAGGFHGLTDMADFARPAFRRKAHAMIKKALDGLDHLFFFGPADLQRAIELYDQPSSKVSLFPFGIDLDFWRPRQVPGEEEGVLSVGSDPKRDYACLLDAPFAGKVRILTRLNVDIPPGREGVEILKGSLFGSAITDEVLRGLYQDAEVVAVPLLDVWQPTGYSVTLQAMACGKPVVLSDIRGLWDREVFRSGENCILVPPHDPQALGEAVRTLQDDATLRARIGAEARKSAEQHFALSRMENALEQMVVSLAKEN